MARAGVLVYSIGLAGGVRRVPAGSSGRVGAGFVPDIAKENYPPCGSVVLLFRAGSEVDRANLEWSTLQEE